MLMAPLSLKFGRHTLADVHVPVLLYSGDGDKLVAIDKNAAALARKLPTAPDFKLLAGAGHFVFMAPCNEEQIAPCRRCAPTPMALTAKTFTAT
jgi:predicted dienelactone hydrolase